MKTCISILLVYRFKLYFRQDARANWYFFKKFLNTKFDFLIYPFIFTLKLAKIQFSATWLIFFYFYFLRLCFFCNWYIWYFIFGIIGLKILFFISMYVSFNLSTCSWEQFIFFYFNYISFGTEIIWENLLFWNKYEYEYNF